MFDQVVDERYQWWLRRPDQWWLRRPENKGVVVASATIKNPTLLKLVAMSAGKECSGHCRGCKDYRCETENN